MGGDDNDINLDDFDDAVEDNDHDPLMTQDFLLNDEEDQDVLMKMNDDDLPDIEIGDIDYADVQFEKHTEGKPKVNFDEDDDEE